MLITPSTEMLLPPTVTAPAIVSKIGMPNFFVILNATTSAAEPESSEIQHVVAVEDVCAWPNLTLTGDGEILAILHNQPAHGTQEGGPES